MTCSLKREPKKGIKIAKKEVMCEQKTVPGGPQKNPV